MIKKDHRIVLLYPPSNYSKHHDFLWDKTIYMEGSYANQDKLSAMQDWNVQEIKTQGGNGMIFELSWTLTTQDSGIYLYWGVIHFYSVTFRIYHSHLIGPLCQKRNFERLRP